MPDAATSSAALSRGQRMEVLALLKRTGGLAVRALAERMDMSYMGVKQYCLELEKQGFLEVRREPRSEGQTGRPTLVYRLTPKAHSLFPTATNDLTLELLEAVQRVYGPSAPEKLLYAVFQRRAETYRAALSDAGITGDAARVLEFSRMRDYEGCLSHVEGISPRATRALREAVLAGGGEADEAPLLPFGTESPEAEPEGPLRIIEHRSPIADLLAHYPIVPRLERELFERVLGYPVQRVDESDPADRYRVVFLLGAE